MNKLRVVLAVIFLMNVTDVVALMTNDSCHQAFEVYCGTILTADWSDATNNDRPFEVCQSINYRKGIWYQIRGTGGIIKASLCDNGSEIVVLEGSCDLLNCDIRLTEHYRYQCSFSSREISFLTDSLSEYYLYCTTSSPHLGSRLEISCVEPSINDECAGATAIVVNQSYSINHLYASSSPEVGCPTTYYRTGDLWFTLDGSDAILYYNQNTSSQGASVIFYEGDCNELTCVEPIRVNSGLVYYTSIDKKYIARLVGHEFQQFEFSFDVTNYEENDNCNGAIFYSLGDTTSLSLKMATTDTTFCDFYYPREGVWVKVNGNDSIITIASTGYYTNLSVFSGECSNLECVDLTLLPRRSRVSFRSDSDSSYLILLTSGADSIDVSSYSDKEVFNNSPSGAPIISCDQTVSGSTVGATADFEFTRNYYPSVWYKIVGTDSYYDFEGIRVEVFKAPLGDRGGVNVSGSFPPSYYLEQDSSYYINFTNSVQSSFYFDVVCREVIENDVCSSSTSVDLADTLNSNTVFSLFDSDEICGYNNTNRRDVWYHFIGDGTLRDVTFSGGGHRLAIFGGDCSNLICVESAFNRPYWTQPSTRRIYFENGMSYYFKFFNYNSSSVSNDFTLYSDILDIAENDVCETARIVECGDIIVDSLDFAVINELNCDSTQSYYGGVWYVFEGADNYYYLEQEFSQHSPFVGPTMQLFKGECNELICHDDFLIRYRGRNVFWAASGELYYIMINRLNRPYEIEIGCEMSFNNNDYRNPFLVFCGESYTGYSLEADYQNVTQCPYSSESNDIWFSITGNDEYVFLNEENYSSGDRAYPRGVYTYRDTTLICYGQFEDNKIYLEENDEYLMRFVIGGETKRVKRDFDISFGCHPSVTNDFCESSYQLKCDEHITINLAHATDDRFMGCRSQQSEDNGIWFEVIGDDSWKEVMIVDSVGEVSRWEVDIYSGDCNEFECENGDFVFFAKEGVGYYILVSKSYRGYAGEVDVSMTCYSSAENDDCEGGLQISCDDTISVNTNFALPCIGSDFSCVTGRSRKDVWYTLEGTGDLMSLELLENESGDRRIHIFKSACCGLRPINTVYGAYSEEAIFQSVQSESYLVAVSSRGFHDEPVTLVVNCQAEETISLCETSIALQDGDYIKLDPTKGIKFASLDNQEYPVSWVNFNGSGGEDTLVLTSTNTTSLKAHGFLDFDGLCQLSRELFFSLRNIFQSSDSAVYTFSTIENENYAVAIGETHTVGTEVDSLSIELILGKEIVEICSPVFPDTISGEGMASVRGFLELNGSGTPFFALLSPGYITSGFINYGSGELDLFFTESGRQVLDYGSHACRGHLLSYFDYGICFDSTLCRDQTLYLDNNGEATLYPVNIYPYSFEGCRTTTISVNKTSFDCNDLGEQIVTLYAEEGCDLFTCNIAVTVRDNRFPTVECQDVILQLDKKGEAALTTEDVIVNMSDNCAIDAVSLSETDFTCTNVGDNAITVTIGDISGNTTICEINVLIEDIPSSSLEIQGPENICPGYDDVPYWINSSPRITGYDWSYSAEGVSLHSGESSSIDLNVSSVAQSGNLSLNLSSYCAEDAATLVKPIVIQSTQVCDLVSCLVDKITLNDENEALIDSLDMLVANKEIDLSISIDKDGLVLFRAGKMIALYPGAEISEGTTLLAEIRKCEQSMSN